MNERKEYIDRLIKVLEFQEEKPDSSSIYLVDKQAEYLSKTGYNCLTKTWHN